MFLLFVVEIGNYRGCLVFGVGIGYRNEGGRGCGSFRGGRGGGYGWNDFNGYGNNRGNNRGGYVNRVNGDGGGFLRCVRCGVGGGIDVNGVIKFVDVFFVFIIV